MPHRSARRQAKTPKKKKSKPKRLFGRMEWKTHLSPFSNSKEKKCFPRRSQLVVTLKRQLAVEFLPREKKSFPKKEPHSHPEKSGSRRVLKKKKTQMSREDPLGSGPEEAAIARAVAPRRRQCSERKSEETRMDISLVGHEVSDIVPTHPPRVQSKQKEKQTSIRGSHN